MTSNILLSILSASTLALGIFAFNGPGGGQGAHSGGPPRTWPPRPVDMVNIDSESAPQPSVPPHGTQAIYAVPNDRWLVVTDIEAISPTSGGNNGLQLVEDLNGVITVKRGGYWPWLFVGPYIVVSFHSAVGISFQPGSTVAWYNPTADETLDARYHITGYLAQ